MTYTGIYNIIYNFHKQHSPPNNSREYWQDTFNDMIGIVDQFPDNKFVRDLLIAIYTELANVAISRENTDAK